MLRVTTVNAVPGMTLAMPVQHQHRAGHVLLKPGAVLDRSTIEKLQEMKIGSLWIRYPALDLVARYVNPNVTEYQSRLTATLAEGLDTATRYAHARMEFSRYASAVHLLLETLVNAPEAALYVHDVVSSGNPLLAHSSAVCYLSLLMGLKLDGYLMQQRGRLDPRRAKRIENLGVGALLHDVGLLRLSPEAGEKWNRTHDLEDPEIRRHVLLGFEMLRGNVAPTAAAVALHHHQRYDGTGFPRIRRMAGPPTPQKGSQIHVFSRIVSVAERFNRLKNPARGRWGSEGAPPLPAVRALKQMMELSREGAVDPVVCRALLAVAPAYPPGSIVRLSNGMLCAVVDWDPSEPCRPRVRPLKSLDVVEVDNGGGVGEVIELREEKALSIVNAEGYDTSADNFRLKGPGEKRGEGGASLMDELEAQSDEPTDVQAVA